MRLSVRVSTGAAVDEVVERGDVWRVRVRARPEKGLANNAVVAVIAKELGVPKSRVSVLRGTASRQKIVEVLE